MRHLSLSLIVGALLLAACDMKNPRVERTSYTQEQKEEDISAAPVAAPVVESDATNTDVRDAGTTSTIEPQAQDDFYSDGSLVEEDVLMQAEEEPVNPRSDENRTYNEKQFSDDETDYPVERSSNGESYDENQIDR